MTTPDLVSVLRPVVAAFERLGVSYYVGDSGTESGSSHPTATPPIGFPLAGLHS
jgi:hypothetical protein